MAEYPLNYHGFKQGLEDGKLLGLTCGDCSSVTAPPNAVCTSCGSSNLAVQELAARGTITTFTVVRVAPLGFTPPYVVALVQLDEGPCVMGNIVEVDPDALDVGLVGRPVAISHQIVPAEGEDDLEGLALTFSLLD